MKKRKLHYKPEDKRLVTGVFFHISIQQNLFFQLTVPLRSFLLGIYSNRIIFKFVCTYIYINGANVIYTCVN